MKKDMNRVDVIMDIEPDYLMDELQNNSYKKPKKTNEKSIKIPNELFQHAIQEGLIEKTDDGYVFVGKYEDVKALKKKNIRV